MNPLIRQIHSYLPAIVGEVVGVLHSKLLVFDNHVLITGYNFY
jgi:hypothetical protein